MVILFDSKPNFIHNLLNGIKILEFKITKNKKIALIVAKILLTFDCKNTNGNKAKIKKKQQKTIPKFLFEGILFFIIIFYIK